jgi:aspartyl-tRNA(Asn)/glutamyl-tRNA(Gln) amidotransferase subunit A
LRVAHAYEQQTESLPAPMVGGNAE